MPHLRATRSNLDASRCHQLMRGTSGEPYDADQAFNANHDADDAEHRTAGKQGDDDDVPERPVVVPERKIKAVKAVIQPTLEPLARGEPRHELARAVDVNRRTIRVP